jgi:hypothetical protein
VKRVENGRMTEDMTDGLAGGGVLIGRMADLRGCVATRSHQPKLRSNGSLSVAEQ